MKISYLFESEGKHALKNLRPKMANIAQDIYDEWDEDAEVYAGGGICHLIADGICSYLADLDIECTTVSCSVGDVHVFVAAKLPDGVYEIDISPYTYESGGGYSWSKIPDVKFEPDDVVVNMLSPNPEDFGNYLEY